MADGVSKSTVKRLPAYIAYLKSLGDSQGENISSKAIADALQMGEVQVRKDLAAVSTGGRPKTGYKIAPLISDLETFLGYNVTDLAVIVGTGRLGRALLEYRGFHEYGLEIAAGFDIDPGALARARGDIPVYPIEEMENVCRSMNIRLGILTVPAGCAGEAFSDMIKCGITAVLNFTPAHLEKAEGVTVVHENIASSLAMLANQIKRT